MSPASISCSWERKAGTFLGGQGTGAPLEHDSLCLCSTAGAPPKSKGATHKHTHNIAFNLRHICVQRGQPRVSMRRLGGFCPAPPFVVLLTTGACWQPNSPHAFPYATQQLQHAFEGSFVLGLAWLATRDASWQSARLATQHCTRLRSTHPHAFKSQFSRTPLPLFPKKQHRK